MTSQHGGGAALGRPVPMPQRAVTHPTIITDATIIWAGPYDLGLLESAARAVGRWHEALRTTVDTDRDEQLVRDYSPDTVSCRIHAAGPGQLMTVLDELATRPLDPAAIPVFRAEIVTESPRRLAIHLGSPHAVADITAMEIVVRDFVLAYQALLAGQDPALAPVQHQFSDYQRHIEAVCDDERTWRPGAPGARAADFWQHKLAGFQLPAFSPAPPGVSRENRMVFLQGRLERDLMERLGQACREARCSVFHAVIAAYEEAVARLTGDDDITTMCIVHGRADPANRNTVGLLTKELAFRRQVRAPSRRAYLGTVAADAFVTYIHQDIPLSAVISRSPAVALLYKQLRYRSVFLQFRPQQFGAGLERAIDGVELAFPHDTRSMLGCVMPGMALFNVDPVGDSHLSVEFIFDGRRWPADEMTRLHEGFLRCLTAYATAPDEPVRVGGPG
jgi:hypothetical protein